MRISLIIRKRCTRELNNLTFCAISAYLNISPIAAMEPPTQNGDNGKKFESYLESQSLPLICGNNCALHGNCMAGIVLADRPRDGVDTTDNRWVNSELAASIPQISRLGSISINVPQQPYSARRSYPFLLSTKSLMMNALEPTVATTGHTTMYFITYLKGLLRTIAFAIGGLNP